MPESKPLPYIDPHIHMSSRTTDDYQAMREWGVVAVIEPAFWNGQPRTTSGTFVDYFSTLLGWERFRASQFGIRHYCAMGLNSKEANNEALAEQILDLLPRFIGKEGVVAIGEIGFDEITPAEEKAFRAQLELAKESGLPVMIHTPHRDKKRGASRSMDICKEHGLPPSKVVVDHNTEETCQEVLDRGYWCGFTIYPKTKMGNLRMVDLIKKYGSERMIVDSSADWGVSDPCAVPKTGRLMLEKGVPPADVVASCYHNALAVYGQSGQIQESDWLKPSQVDRTLLFEGNSILRGQAATSPDIRIIE